MTAKGRLAELRDELVDQIREIEAEIAPLRQEREDLEARLSPENARSRELGRRIRELEAARGLGSLKQDLAGVARALGGRSMSDVA